MAKKILLWFLDLFFEENSLKINFQGRFFISVILVNIFSYALSNFHSHLHELFGVGTRDSFSNAMYDSGIWYGVILISVFFGFYVFHYIYEAKFEKFEKLEGKLIESYKDVEVLEHSMNRQFEQFTEIEREHKNLIAEVNSLKQEIMVRPQPERNDE